MMQYASQGVRNAARKGSNALVHHGGHNGPGGSTTTNQTSRTIHLFSQLQTIFQTPHVPVFQSIRPRSPPHKLFSASKNLLQRFFTHLTAPGFRIPSYLYENGTRSLHNPVRGYTIQSGLSLPARHALRNNALQRQAKTFLPRAPPVPPRCGGVAQVGLGSARNFSTVRPIFQNLAQNVPVAGRALYEIDWDLEMRKEHERMRLMARTGVKKVEKTKEMMKPAKRSQQFQASANAKKRSAPQENDIVKEDMEHYFPAVRVPLVTTYLLIPLAPTPTSRLPLPLNPEVSPGQQPGLLPSLSYIGAFHDSHSTHTLRVSTLFTRLDQANVWAHGGVQCSAYSQGRAHRRNGFKPSETDDNQEGVCTVLEVQFIGWTKAEVRGVIGESGSGWCVLEEVFQGEDLLEDEGLSDIDSLSTGLLEDQTSFSPPFDMGMDNTAIDPARSFILPTLDFSSFLHSRSSSSENVLASIPSEMEVDPWVDDYPFSSSSGSSSYSDLSESIINPPSSNGWFGAGHGLGPGVTFTPRRGSTQGAELEPREMLF
ncbi:hypothetical protein GALMADRAFT_207112 [Galerina marginata CBS 339.88]|uniref:Uncharacterized protein n=1 Tax=Galerina marginata (strain CBS 339.88) TaxID=685588 RepID=A0A067TET1_GALM3|nr:hypothetical protein GALMADRAFT_207112 [Galerina marginata CBS 339.88]